MKQYAKIALLGSVVGFAPLAAAAADSVAVALSASFEPVYTYADDLTFTGTGTVAVRPSPSPAKRTMHSALGWAQSRLRRHRLDPGSGDHGDRDRLGDDV
ncbi:hypothetical protein [Cereibacter sphaeroides]|uniref:hypothetical protein n=1 Tax=Cereibacter sphaeroides TaxID=1063 RepID=UPI0021564B4F|nr:hypothetical protein [Cereibacter sphaeroides]